VPELPEVETVVRALRPCLRDRVIAAARVTGKPLRSPWRAAWSRMVAGRRVVAIRRRGKWILVDLDKSGSLLFHLGMTGRLRVLPGSEPLTKHTHLVFRLTPGGEELRFHDPRRFGAVRWLKTGDRQQFLNGAELGPEPWALTANDLWLRLLKTRRCLKAVLLDQRVAAGIGNIYADEALFEARLSPARLGATMTRAEARRLRQAIVTVLDRAIAKNGSTIRDFFFGEEEAGGYQKEFRVYQRTGRPCPRCRTPIQQTRLAGRSTHFCPRCQR
jgi:formamidopyrimidine-DNA glycosylase